MDRTFTLDTLIQDDTFIKWVRAGQPPDETWSTWVQSSSANQTLTSQAAAVILSLQVKPPEAATETLDRIWSAVDHEINEEVQEAPRAGTKRRWLRPLSIAAGLLLIGAVYWLVQPSDPSYYTAHAESQEIRLPDGSIAHMNAGSRVSYDRDRWESARMVRMEGEVFFDVEKGSTFTVASPSGLTQVLGTSFNVYDREHDLTVSCYTGRVQVTGEGEEPIILAPGQRIIYDDRDEPVLDSFQTSDVDWRSGQFSYRQEQLHEVFNEIERQFDVRLICKDDNIGRRRYTGTFHSHSIEEALHAVCWPMRLSYRIDGKRVMINQEDE